VYLDLHPDDARIVLGHRVCNIVAGYGISDELIP
jgi:hypothetical protein